MPSLKPNDFQLVQDYARHFKNELISGYLATKRTDVTEYTEEELLSSNNLGSLTPVKFFDNSAEEKRLAVLEFLPKPSKENDQIPYDSQIENERKLIQKQLEIALEEAKLEIFRKERNQLRKIFKKKVNELLLNEDLSAGSYDKIDEIKVSLNTLNEKIQNIHKNLSQLYFDHASRCEISGLFPKFKILLWKKRAWISFKKAAKEHLLATAGIGKLKEHKTKLTFLLFQKQNAQQEEDWEELNTQIHLTDYAIKTRKKVKLFAKTSENFNENIKNISFRNQLRKSKRFWGFNTRKFLNVIQAFTPETIIEMLQNASAKELKQIQKVLFSKPVKKLLANLNNLTQQKNTSAKNFMETIQTAQEYTTTRIDLLIGKNGSQTFTPILMRTGRFIKKQTQKVKRLLMAY